MLHLRLMLQVLLVALEELWLVASLALGSSEMTRCCCATLQRDVAAQQPVVPSDYGPRKDESFLAQQDAPHECDHPRALSASCSEKELVMPVEKAKVRHYAPVLPVEQALMRHVALELHSCCWEESLVLSSMAPAAWVQRNWNSQKCSLELGQRFVP